MEDAMDRIRGFIGRELLFDAQTDEALSDDAPLLDGGIIDSLGLMRLVAFLEEEFGIEIEDADIRLEHFRTVEDIARLVERLRGQERDVRSAAPSA